jgi:hypothetical protein
MARQQGLRMGKDTIPCPQGMFEVADRLAAEHFYKEMRFGEMPIGKVLGTIYLMGFMHAFAAMDELERRNKLDIEVREGSSEEND